MSSSSKIWFCVMYYITFFENLFLVKWIEIENWIFTFENSFQMLFWINWTTRIGWIVNKYCSGSVINQWLKVIKVNLPGSLGLNQTSNLQTS